MSNWIKFDTGTSHHRVAAFRVHNKLVAMTTNVYLLLSNSDFFVLFPNREAAPQWERAKAGYLFADAESAQEAGRFILNECRKQWGQEVTKNIQNV